MDCGSRTATHDGKSRQRRLALFLPHIAQEVGGHHRRDWARDDKREKNVATATVRPNSADLAGLAVHQADGQEHRDD